jgi:hypothetical protein
MVKVIYIDQRDKQLEIDLYFIQLLGIRAVMG